MTETQGTNPDTSPQGLAEEEQEATHASDEERTLLEWEVHRLRTDRHTARVLLVLLIVVNVGLLAVYRSVPLVLIGDVILIGAMSDFLFPIRYRLTTKGAYAKNLFQTSRIAWTEVKRCLLAEFGVKLSPLNRASWLDGFRGIVLRFDGHRDEIVEHVKRLAVHRTRGSES